MESNDWFAGRLRELRLAAGLSRKQLAEASGVKPGTVRDLEQGVRRPLLATAKALAVALGVTLDAIASKPQD